MTSRGRADRFSRARSRSSTSAPAAVSTLRRPGDAARFRSAKLRPGGLGDQRRTQQQPAASAKQPTTQHRPAQRHEQAPWENTAFRTGPGYTTTDTRQATRSAAERVGHFGTGAMGLNTTRSSSAATSRRDPSPSCALRPPSPGGRRGVVRSFSHREKVAAGRMRGDPRCVETHARHGEGRDRGPRVLTRAGPRRGHDPDGAPSVPVPAGN